MSDELLCVFCGSGVHHPVKFHRLNGEVYGLLWWCAECSGKCWEGGEYRFYGRQSIHKAKTVPEGCLFIPKDFRA